jgi:hypothetical protein
MGISQLNCHAARKKSQRRVSQQQQQQQRRDESGNSGDFSMDSGFSGRSRTSLGGKIKESGSSAKKWIASRLSECSTRTSNTSNDTTSDDNKIVALQLAQQEQYYLDFEMEEEFEPDVDLYELIQHRPWKPEERVKYDDDAIFWYALHHPNSFRARYDFGKQGRGKIKHFPLPRILSLGASLRTVEAVVAAYPPALLFRHHLQRTTALHAACAFPSPHFQAGVIQFLLDLNPPSVAQTNRHAFLPIHNACCACLPSPIGLEAIQILVEAYPQSISHTNKLGETPLQAARRNHESLPDVLRYLEEIQQQQQTQQHQNEGVP